MLSGPAQPEKPAGNETGTKLSCEVCGSQVAVTKGGPGQVRCCGRAMIVVSGQRPAGGPVRNPPTKTDDPYYD